MSFLEAFYDEMRKLALNKETCDDEPQMARSSRAIPPFKDEKDRIGATDPPLSVVQARRMAEGIVKTPKKAEILKTAEDGIIMDLLSKLLEKKPKPEAQARQAGEKVAGEMAYPQFLSEKLEAERKKRIAKAPKIRPGPYPSLDATVAPHPASTNPHGPVPKPAPAPVPLSERSIKTGMTIEAVAREYAGRIRQAALADKKKLVQTGAITESGGAAMASACAGGKSASVVAGLREKLAEMVKEAPFKSKAQRRKFYALKAQGEMDQKTIDEWEKETPSKIPERLPKKSKTAGIFDRLFRRNKPSQLPAAQAAPILNQLEHPKKEEGAAAPEAEGRKGMFRKIMVFGDDIVLGGLKLLKKEPPIPG